MIFFGKQAGSYVRLLEVWLESISQKLIIS